MSDEDSTATEVKVHFNWEIEPYLMPTPVNQAAATSALEGYGDSDSNIILRLGYALPPMNVDVEQDEVEIPIVSHGAFLLSLDTAKGIQSALGDVIKALEDTEEE